MARIPEETIERIRNTADIYDVVALAADPAGTFSVSLWSMKK